MLPKVHIHFKISGVIKLVYYKIEFLWWLIPFNNNLPMTEGSRSTNTARGTCFPEPVSLKKVLKESSPRPMVLSLGILPSGWMPCSRQYNSQHAFPICTPAWPTWMEMHSRYTKKKKSVKCVYPKPLHKTAFLQAVLPITGN